LVFLAAAVACQLLALASAEVYSSASDMMKIFNMEMDLVKTLDTYSDTLQAKLNRINAYMQDFDHVMREREAARNEIEFNDRVAGNPIHAYNLVKRLTVDWKRVEQDLAGHEVAWKETAFQLKKRRLGTVQPKEEDLHGSAQAIIRLQDVYQLDVRDMSQGDIDTRAERYVTKARLTAQDCLFMGKHCFNAGSLARSLEWFEEAWVLAGAEGNKTVRQDQVQQFLDHAAKEHDTRVLRGETSRHLFPKPVHEEPPLSQRQKVYESHAAEFAKNLTIKSASDDDDERYKALCRGEELRPMVQVSRLKCRHATPNGDPYFRLQPVKLEELHLEPGLWMIHDVISAREMKTIREVATPILMRSQVQGSRVDSDSQISKIRTSKNGWLQDSRSPVISKVTKRVGHITGLNTDTWSDGSELLQVANYINGGHYVHHHDYLFKDKDPNHLVYGDPQTKERFIGDRIATWMFYLNNVASGGRTVFPRLGTGTVPVEGAAVFWYNLTPSGRGNKLTLHGACPILFGTKWVGNKWIREGAQILKKPCGLSMNDRHVPITGHVDVPKVM